MSESGKPDLLYILKRRRFTFERWCLNMGIQTQEDFNERCKLIDAGDDYFISDEMKKYGSQLPSRASLKPVANETMPTPSLKFEAPQVPLEAQEKPSKANKIKNAV